MNYTYSIDGTAAHGQTWSSRGVVTVENFTTVLGAVLEKTFVELTDGRAVFGKPGKGCAGPYVITRLVLERV